MGSKLAGKATSARGIELDGDRVRKLRTAKGWTQEDFAAETGFSVRTISAAESGEPRAPRIWKGLAKALGVDAESLLAHVDGTPKPDEIVVMVNALLTIIHEEADRLSREYAVEFNKRLALGQTAADIRAELFSDSRRRIDGASNCRALAVAFEMAFPTICEKFEAARDEAQAAFISFLNVIHRQVETQGAARLDVGSEMRKMMRIVKKIRHVIVEAIERPAKKPRPK